jgi:hypothetical protein
LVRQTEHLGRLLIAGLATSIAYAGWAIPRPLSPRYRDPVTDCLEIASMLLALVATIWTLRMLAQSAALARILLERARLADEGK